MATKDYMDPRWQKVRLRIMERDGFACRCCGSKEKTLHVHHRSYQKGKRIWDSPEHHLVTLCEPCHERADGIIAASRFCADMWAKLEINGFCEGDIHSVLAGMLESASARPELAKDISDSMQWFSEMTAISAGRVK